VVHRANAAQCEEAATSLKKYSDLKRDKTSK